jgi:peptidyl-tRNA hydrolase, PTH1 family
MKLIVGLGNPGVNYQDTRHNIGFMVVDKLARELGTDTVSWQNNSALRSEIAKIGEVMLVKPQTFMNRSGDAVSAIVSYFKLKPEDVWVIHDDIDLPIGKIRIREQGASGGHNGIDSVISSLKTDKFVRFRLGIGRGKESTGSNTNHNLRHRTVISYVLSRFRENEAGSMKKLVKYGTEAVRMAINDGIDKAMNRFN